MESEKRASSPKDIFRKVVFVSAKLYKCFQRPNMKDPMLGWLVPGKYRRLRIAEQFDKKNKFHSGAKP